MNRRHLLLSSAASAVGLGVVGTARGVDAKKPAVRAAHITDVHITHDRDSSKGVAALFAHLFGQKDWKPELVLNTGDAVMALDGKTTGERAAEQIALWKAAVKACPVPIRSCLGNHDVWDGKEPTEAVPASKKGIALMTEVLGMPAPYYSFDHGGWHFVALNSVCNWPDYGALSAEHMKWLRDDLAKTKPTTPVCVLSHLPIVSVTSSLYGDEQKKGNGVLVPKTWQHVDCWEISEVFRRHPNVKLCLSGHMHTADRCEYRGVWYICGGAASGAWWEGSEYGFPPCYGAIDLFADGTFEYRFVDYEWKARQWKGKEWKG
jgi:predicted MPP superfamily phosphohydrolase